ncbi:unnamed protein product [Blepharisma stoltei]|uniref:Calmodulin n=1 Tax=Blepharisma stoltei TaxID=1481888 RepID=A0AAU9IBE6_9CILI|nr:unnamed protein product [Blepharisma stoltei]
MAKSNVFKTWNDFIRHQGSYEGKMNFLRSSNLDAINPQTQRPLAWLGIIDPNFSTETMEYYRSVKLTKQVILVNSIAQRIKQDALKSFSGSLSSLNSGERIQKIVTLLSIFASKRNDIGYCFGMNFIAAVLVSVFSSESDAFIMFCYIIEKVFPENFFSLENRQIVLHSELRAFAIMAERLRPRLVNSLRAIFKPLNTSLRESDYSPFVVTIKRVGDFWFHTLFATSILPGDLLRVWDNVLIHGFEFVHKFGLTILSKNERFFKNNIKQEAKVLNMGTTVDSLISSGNAARNRLLRKVEKIPVEKMIKKAIYKPTYRAVKRSEILPKAEELEKNHLEPLIRLRQSKEFLRSKGNSFTYKDAKEIFNLLQSLENGGKISRSLFLTMVTKNLNWAPQTALHVFNSFDHNGNDSVDVLTLKSGLSLLIQGELTEKLKLCFESFDRDNSGSLEPEEVVDLVCFVENALDGRSSFFRNQSGSLFANMDRNSNGRISLDEFIKAVTTDPSCEPILEFINAVESEEFINIPEMRMARINLEGTFSDVHTPDKPSADASPMSDVSYDGPDFAELESRLGTLLQNDIKELENEYEEAPEITGEKVVEIDAVETEGNGVRIHNEYDGENVKFVFHVGDIVEEDKKNESEDNTEIHIEAFGSFKPKEEEEEPAKNVTVEEIESPGDLYVTEIKQKHSLEEQRNIDIPEPTSKESRGTCSRLCTRGNCGLF